MFCLLSYSNNNAFLHIPATSVTGYVDFLCEGALWRPVWMKKTAESWV